MILIIYRTEIFGAARYLESRLSLCALVKGCNSEIKPQTGLPWYEIEVECKVEDKERVMQIITSTGVELSFQETRTKD